LQLFELGEPFSGPGPQVFDVTTAILVKIGLLDQMPVLAGYDARRAVKTKKPLPKTVAQANEDGPHRERLGDQVRDCLLQSAVSE
jgi:hypothetical protein